MSDEKIIELKQEETKEEKVEEKKLDEKDLTIMQKELVSKLMKIITETNFPLPLVVSSLEMIKFEVMTNAYFSMMLARDAMENSKKRIVMPQNKIPNFKKY